LDRDDDRRDGDKRLAAEAAVAEVRDGMIVGLGTGSTAAHAIRAIGALVDGGMKLEAVATSEASAAAARGLGVRVLDFAEVGRCDLAIDGADEIDGRLRAIKGAGGAMLREKLVAASAGRMVVVADGSKRVERLGAAPVPVEVLPFGRAYVMRMLTKVTRVVPRGTYRTDNGAEILDCYFNTLFDAEGLAERLQTIPGVLGHGLFLTEVDAAYIAEAGVVTRVERPTRPD